MVEVEATSKKIIVGYGSVTGNGAACGKYDGRVDEHVRAIVSKSA